ncbi:MAG: isoprenylcysteine carboxylmethyltransferase family protein [Pseudomonadota bacterium]
MNEAPIDRPSRFPWPPVLTLIFVILAWLGTPPSAVPTIQTWLGLGLILAGLTFDAIGAAHLLRHKTAVLPHRAASHLVTNGPFRFSRNPIYVGYVLILIGVALIRPGVVSIMAVGAFSVLLLKLAIEPEERHLKSKFGAEWQAYATQVPRWLGPI